MTPPNDSFITAQDLRTLMQKEEERRHRERAEAEERARPLHEQMVARYRDSHLTETERMAVRQEVADVGDFRFHGALVVLPASPAMPAPTVAAPSTTRCRNGPRP